MSRLANYFLFCLFFSAVIDGITVFAAFFAINKEFRKPAEAPELFMVP